ncbi:MAG: T9SS type A sorting domain-containing protein [Bacteroidales bacterium]|nr:T9SS type A sorting domain-containing protein [Bacteroidales bacterium]
MKKIFYLLVLISSVSYGQNPKVIAHRGGAGTAPENTLAAFNNAVQVNADYFELDVMISSDDSLMIMHDATVDRTTDGTGSIASLTYSQLKELDAGSWFSAEFEGEPVPTLYEAMMVAKNSANDIGVVIEIKSSDASVPAAVVAMIQKLEMESRVIVSSFSLSQITEVKLLDPTIAVQLFGTITESNIDQVVAINGDWVGSGGNLTQTVIDYAHIQGIYFNAWTLNSASTMLPAIALGVDGITTDFPVVLLTLLDDTEPSDVVLSSAIPLETKVTLNWEPAVDDESGIAGYDIYRDTITGPTTLVASVGNVLEYVDETYMESQLCYYRIKARNLAGLSSVNYSNEISVATLNDITPPVVQYVTSRGDSNTVVIGFSERIDTATAETATNYTLNHGATVESSLLAMDGKSVMLTTSPLSEQSYLMTVKNVLDLAVTPNKMVTLSTIFLHYGIPDSAVAFYKLDSLPFAAPDYLVIDETENENNGIALNGAYTSEGILGNSLSFDGVDDYVEFTASESFDINASAVTLSLWTKLPYKPSELPVPYSPLFDSETDNYVLYGDRGNNELRFKVVTSGGAERPGIPDADIRTGEWIHVVGVYDGTNAMVYLNGELKDTHPLTGTVKTGQVATLGKTGTTYFQGSIDQVEVYNRALSREEIMLMYTGIREAPISRNPGSVKMETPSVDETMVTLNWSDAVNYESEIMGYEIYRDTTQEATTLYATAGNVTEFADNSCTENQTFYYRVKAKNTLGLLSGEYSNEVSATTGTDLTRPKVAYVTSRGENPGIFVEFTEKLDQTSAEDIANYSIDQSVTVTGATLALDQKTVILATSGLSEQTYTLTLNGIKDLAAIPNVIFTDTKVVLTHEAEPADLIAWYQMNGLPVSGPDTLLLDETANTNNGLVKNQPELAEGLLGNAVKFDNTKKQYVQFENSPSFDVGDTMVSISVWTKLTYLPVEMPEAYGPLFDSQGDEYVIYADRVNKELRFKVVTSAKAERPGIPNDDLVTGQWINVFAVYDGINAMIYLNGELKDTHPITGTVKPGIIPMLGKSGTSGTPAFFNGSIDNVQVFKRGFTQEEIVEMVENYRMKAVPGCEQYDLSEDVTICSGESYTFPDGTVGTETMEYVSVLTALYGCDSIITTNLTVRESYDLSEDVTICSGESYTFPDGTVGTVTMVYASELTSVYGCDSIITTNLTISEVDVSVSQDNGVLTAGASGGAFRWLDCENGNAVISGETGQSFTPSVAGNYAVEVTMADCIDTSDCVYAEPVGIGLSESTGFKIFPNPSNGVFTLEMQESAEGELHLQVIDATGKIVHNEVLTGTGNHIIDLSAAHEGIYLIRVITKSGSIEKRIIIL